MRYAVLSASLLVSIVLAGNDNNARDVQYEKRTLPGGAAGGPLGLINGIETQLLSLLQLGPKAATAPGKAGAIVPASAPKALTPPKGLSPPAPKGLPGAGITPPPVLNAVSESHNHVLTCYLHRFRLYLALQLYLHLQFLLVVQLAVLLRCSRMPLCSRPLLMLLDRPVFLRS